MSFKIHLLIVSVIILVVYLVWGISRSTPDTGSSIADTKPTYVISVTHASWGLNCPDIAGNDDILDKAYVKKSDLANKRPYQDNALAIVSDYCNSKTDCDIPLSGELFKGMAPKQCSEKKLAVEYRCFTYDRPWRAEASNIDGMLSITCKGKEPK